MVLYPRVSRPVLILLSASVFLILGGCATSAVYLKPDAVPAGEAALFGRIQVLNRGEDLTESCNAEFTDAQTKRKAFVSLDKTGWIFTTAAQGETYLSLVACKTGGIFKHFVMFKTREMKFNTKGNGKLTYFGHVTITMDVQGGFSAAYLLGGAGAGAMAGAGENADTKSVTVENHLEDASHEFESRFPASSNQLKTTIAVMNPPTLERGPASVPDASAK